MAGNSLCLSVPSFSHLSSGGNSCPYFLDLWEVSELICVMCLEPRGWPLGDVQSVTAMINMCSSGGKLGRAFFPQTLLPFLPIAPYITPYSLHPYGLCLPSWPVSPAPELSPQLRFRLQPSSYHPSHACPLSGDQIKQRGCEGHGMLSLVQGQGHPELETKNISLQDGVWGGGGRDTHPSPVGGESSLMDRGERVQALVGTPLTPTVGWAYSQAPTG